MEQWLKQKFQTDDLVEAISALSFDVVIWAALALFLLLGLAILSSHHERFKPWLFGMIVLVVVSSTLSLIGTTIYLNKTSISGGPVHWHADFEVWACGEPLAANVLSGGEYQTVDDFKDPVGALSNKIGTPVLHEHNDLRIHLEGVVVEPRDASLGKFFEVVGGGLTDRSLTLPTNDGQVNLISGQTCAGQPAELSVFVYQTRGDRYYVKNRLKNPAEYVVSPESIVPPGDCVIIEFDDTPDETDKLCEQYEVGLRTDKVLGEVIGEEIELNGGAP